MRKLHYILAGLVLVFALVSCEKQNKHDLDIDAMKAAKATQIINEPILSTDAPTLIEDVTPWNIPGENPGGNRTCEEVEMWLDIEIDLCGDQVDFDEETGSFVSSFPNGLSVSVDDIYVSFEMDECLPVGDKYYKVAAVIVKGANMANVYIYPEGVIADAGLFAPGEKPMVSNLTFCFVECDIPDPDWVIAFKSKAKLASGVIHPVYTIGIDIPNDNNSIGYNELGYGIPFDIIINDTDEVIATITATEVVHNGAAHILVEVLITSSEDWEIAQPHLYIGTLEGLDGRSYTDYPFDGDDVIGEPCTFLIPVTDILL